MNEMELSRTGKIVRWQHKERDLLARPRSGMPGGANLYFTHRGVESLKQDRAPFLHPNHQEPNSFTAQVMMQNGEVVAWQYKLWQLISSQDDVITYQIGVERAKECENRELMPITFGLMFHFATLGNFAQLTRNGAELASTNDEYNYELQPLSFFDSQDRHSLETPHGDFALIGVSGADGIILDSMTPDRHFGVMLTGGAFIPIKLAPGGYVIQNVTIHYKPKLR